MVSKASMQFTEEEKRPSRNEILTTWDTVIQRYSKCQLTYETDKLTALSGLASHVKDILGDTEVFGMWRRNIEFQLTWLVIGKEGKEAKKTRNEPRRLSQNIAPS